MNLHLGCGDKILPDYVNCDLYPCSDEVVRCDIKKLPFDDDSVDVIYACHVLEHIFRREVSVTLKEWNRVLKKGGKLYVAVPDFESVVKHYNKYSNIDEIQGLLNGGQTYDGNEHYVSFDFNYMKRALMESGFDNIQKYDWKETEYADFDDFSKAYLPHMDFEKGRLMMLNIRCEK